MPRAVITTVAPGAIIAMVRVAAFVELVRGAVLHGCVLVSLCCSRRRGLPSKLNDELRDELLDEPRDEKRGASEWSVRVLSVNIEKKRWLRSSSVNAAIKNS